MGMRLGIVRESFSPPENQTWLGSAHGNNTWESITLDSAAFLTAFPTGIVPSGVVVRRVTSSGLYVPYAAGTSGERVFHLATTVDLHGTTSGTVVPTPAAGMWHGQVIVAKLPTGHGLVAAAATAMKLVDYVGAVPA